MILRVRSAALLPAIDPRQTHAVSSANVGRSGPQTQPGLSLAELFAAISTTTQYQDLVNFARRRLRRLAASHWNKRTLAGLDPEELVAEAVLQVGLGELDPALGRRLSARNRASAGAFVLCLKGIIHSNLGNCLKRVEAGQEYVPIGDEPESPGSVDPADPNDLNALLDRRDLQRVVFERLYRRVAAMPALLPIIQDWEPNFLSANRVGDRTRDRNLDHRVRQLVQEILKELARELAPGTLGGKEMLL